MLLATSRSTGGVAEVTSHLGQGGPVLLAAGDLLGAQDVLGAATTTVSVVILSLVLGVFAMSGWRPSRPIAKFGSCRSVQVLKRAQNLGGLGGLHVVGLAEHDRGELDITALPMFKRLQALGRLRGGAKDEQPAQAPPPPPPAPAGSADGGGGEAARQA